MFSELFWQMSKAFAMTFTTVFIIAVLGVAAYEKLVADRA